MNQVPQTQREGSLSTPAEFNAGRIIRPQPSVARWRPNATQALFFLMVGLPVALAIIYYGIIASERYVSEAQLTVRSMDSQPGNALLGVLGSFAAGAGGSKDAPIVEAYIRSPEIVERLQQWVDLRQIWNDPRGDIVARLGESVTREELHEYYLDRVDTVYDSKTGVITVAVQAFTPNDAQTIAEAIVTLADALVNAISEKARQDTVSFTQVELERARMLLEGAQTATLEFRNQHGELDPAASAGAIGGIVASLEGELATKEAELSSLRSYMRDDTHRVVTLNSQIAALKKQIAFQRARLADLDNDALSELVFTYQRLVMNEELMREGYSLALQAMETARIEASRKQLYLVAFVPPTLPEEGAEPQRVLAIATVALGGFISFGILILVIAAVREHARL